MTAENHEKTLIIGDSILKYIEDWTQEIKLITHSTRNIKVTCIRGCTFKKIYQKLTENTVQIQDYKTIIIHLGTNDLDTYPNRKVNFYFVQLVDKIKQHNPQAILTISTPIPRPKDHQTTHGKIKKFIKWLLDNRTKGKYSVWRSDKTFLQKARNNQTPGIRDPTDYHKDGLHINRKGTQRLIQQLKMALSYGH